MLNHQIVAHRGLWTVSKEKNSPEAISRALKQGFSLETDFRDHNGKIIISHDPKKLKEKVFSFNEFIKLSSKFSSSKTLIAANIKADGLAYLLTKKKELKIKNFYFFDMSIPDHISFINSGFNSLARVSDLEDPKLKFSKLTDGFWIDFFFDETEIIKNINYCLSKNKKTILVSSELHHKDKTKMWNSIYNAGLFKNKNFYLCTDLPYEALTFFNE